MGRLGISKGQVSSKGQDRDRYGMGMGWVRDENVMGQDGELDNTWNVQ